MYRFYLYKFLIDFWLIVPVIVPFYKAHGMNATQIMTVQAAFSLSQLLFEVPSGYLSDVIGRRRTLIAAAVLMVCGVGIYAFSDAFGGFIIAEIVLGLAGALRSGTDSAILYDLLKSVRDEHRYKQYEGRAEFWCRLGTATSSIGGALLGAYTTLRLPFYVNMGSALLMVLVGFSLQEPYRAERPRGNPLTGIARISLQSIAHPELFSVMLRMAIIFSTGVTAIWGYFLLYRKLGLPLWSHGVIFAVMQITSAFSARHAEAIEHFVGQRNSRMFLWGIGPLFLVIGMSGTPLLLLPLVVIHAALWGMSTPLLLENIQQYTTSDIRATTLSVGSMIGRVFTILWGPAFGWIVDRSTIGWAFAAMAVFALATQPLIVAVIRVVGGAFNRDPTLRDGLE